MIIITGPSFQQIEFFFVHRQLYFILFYSYILQWKHHILFHDGLLSQTNFWLDRFIRCLILNFLFALLINLDYYWSCNCSQMKLCYNIYIWLSEFLWHFLFIYWNYAFLFIRLYYLFISLQIQAFKLNLAL